MESCVHSLLVSSITYQPDSLKNFQGVQSSLWNFREKLAHPIVKEAYQMLSLLCIQKISNVAYVFQVSSRRCHLCTGWQRPIGCHKLQVIFCKRAINYRGLLGKMTFKHKASCGSSPPCIMSRYTMVFTQTTLLDESQMTSPTHQGEVIWLSRRSHVLFVCRCVPWHDTQMTALLDQRRMTSPSSRGHLCTDCHVLQVTTKEGSFVCRDIVHKLPLLDSHVLLFVIR